MGVYPGFTTKLPGTPGFDGMGVVTKVGSAVSGFKEGQRVTSLGWMGHEGNGSWQQYINVPAERVVGLPDGISDEAGAQFYINPITVIGLLEVSGAKAGEHIVITAAGSTLGRMLIAAAKAQGIQTIGVVRRAEAVQELKDSTGCDEVVCSTTEDLVARVKAFTEDKGAAAVIDSVGGSLSQALGAAVRDGGSVWLYGLMDGLTITGSGVDCLFRDVAYRGFWFVPWLFGKPEAERQAIIQKTLQLMLDKVLDPPIGKVFPLKDFAAAVAESQKVGRLGKVLLKLH
jgi:NADPH:quinone reductase-like Zn-dependent oxidoreductase